ncbi:MAG: hypothetical protein JW929_11900 [Anaerolineales bacterium]|nr:hypothetical protein [Anaerolineales bacterium]
MTAIAGIERGGKKELVKRMLEKMAHRGGKQCRIIESGHATIGVAPSAGQESSGEIRIQQEFVEDGSGPGRFARARIADDGLELTRDPVGVAPLYYGWTEAGELCFASEVKGLLPEVRRIHELAPGSSLRGGNLDHFFRLNPGKEIDDPPQTVAAGLRRRLEQAVEKSLAGGKIGSWLSGGLDSSSLAALASRHVDRLPTFAAGLENAPDLEFARRTAAFLRTDHHEVVVKSADVIAALPEVIYHLESFDALLVRSSVLNYLVAKEAANFVPAVLSGEGGDELFAGYEYLKSIDSGRLKDELLDITGRLHNTALQRVDRCASAHATTPHVCFLDPEVVEYALRIPVEYKLRNGVEKWILREAVGELLPSEVRQRPKAKFWQGAGVEDLLARYAENNVSSEDFKRERRLPNGWQLNTKEELLYYRLFRENFGSVEDLAWMGRTKGAPTAL